MKSVASNTGKYWGLGMTSDRTRARMVEALRARGSKNEAVLVAMGAVPRHVFVDEALQERAYEVNNALPIGQGQTISTPEIVAIMTELLFENGPRNKVLEIGTGCGYQTAILAHGQGSVYRGAHRCIDGRGTARVAQLACDQRHLQTCRWPLWLRQCCAL